MNNKNLGILSLLTVLGILIAVVLAQKQPETPGVTSQPVVFPKLMSQINEVDEVMVKTATDSFTLLREQEQWGLKDKYQYPVALDKMRKVLLGLAELTLLEAKTTNTELYTKLSVEDVSAPDAKSVLLTLNAKGQTVATLIVGRDQVAKSDPTRREVYIRKPGESQSWSALGLLPLEKKSTDWLDKEIVNVETQRLRQVQIKPPQEKEGVTFSKKQPKDSDYVMAEMPEHAALTSPQILRQIANVVSFLNLEDVVPVKEVEFTDDLTTQAVFMTFDGLEVTVKVLNKEGKYYAQFSARFVPEAIVKPEVEQPSEGTQTATPPDEKSEADKRLAVEQEAHHLNAKWGSWVFVLPDYKASLLVKKRDELIKVEILKPAEEMGEVTTTSHQPLEVPVTPHEH